jgi:hypothetical protein
VQPALLSDLPDVPSRDAIRRPSLGGGLRPSRGSNGSDGDGPGARCCGGGS